MGRLCHRAGVVTLVFALWGPVLYTETHKAAESSLLFPHPIPEAREGVPLPAFAFKVDLAAVFKPDSSGKNFGRSENCCFAPGSEPVSCVRLPCPVATARRQRRGLKSGE